MTIDSIDSILLAKPELHWSPPNPPQVLIPLPSQIRADIDSPEIHIRLNGNLKGRYLRTQRLHFIAENEFVAVEHLPCSSFCIEDSFGNKVFERKVLAWDAASKVIFVEIESGRLLAPQVTADDWTELYIIVPNDATILPRPVAVADFEWCNFKVVKVERSEVWSAGIKILNHGDGDVLFQDSPSSAEKHESSGIRLIVQWAGRPFDLRDKKIGNEFRVTFRLHLTKTTAVIRGVIVMANETEISWTAQGDLYSFTLPISLIAEPIRFGVTISHAGRTLTTSTIKHVLWTGAVWLDSDNRATQFPSSGLITSHELSRKLMLIASEAPHSPLSSTKILPKDCRLFEENQRLSNQVPKAFDVSNGHLADHWVMTLQQPKVISGLGGRLILEAGGIPLVVVADEVVDRGCVCRVERDRDQLRVHFHSPIQLDQNHVLWIWVPNKPPEAFCLGEPSLDLTITPNGLSVAVSISDANLVAAAIVSYGNWRVGGWFDPETWALSLTSTKREDASFIAIWLRWARSPILSRRLNAGMPAREVVSAFLMKNLPDVLGAWLEPSGCSQKGGQQLLRFKIDDPLWIPAVRELLLDGLPRVTSDNADEVLSMLDATGTPADCEVRTLSGVAEQLLLICPVLAFSAITKCRQFRSVLNKRQAGEELIASLKISGDQLEQLAHQLKIDSNYLIACVPPLSLLGGEAEQTKAFDRSFRRLANELLFRKLAFCHWICDFIGAPRKKFW